MEQKLARIISTLFVPPAVGFLTMVYFAFSFENSFSKSLTVIFVALVLGLILPIIVFFYLKKRGKIFDIDATIKEERTIPYIIGVILYTVGVIIMFLAGINVFTLTFWISYITNTILLISINRFWKISAHAIGVSMPLAALTFANGWIGFSFIWLLVLVCWSRLKLRVHTPSQVMAGVLLGFLFTYLQMSLITGILSNVIKK